MQVAKATATAVNVGETTVSPGIVETPADPVSQARSRKWFARFAALMLAWNIPVILWGAYVRASFSGDGCGANWPFCNGQVIPQHMAKPMAIEYTHRMMTIIDCIGVVAMCVWAFLAYPRQQTGRHAVRRYAVLSLVFLLIEALLGAGLVLLRYVARDQSAGRAVYLSAHLTNTLLLLGALTITTFLAFRGQKSMEWSKVPRAVFWTLPVTATVSVTGAIAALGDTLFPSASFSGGLQQDFASGVNLLIRLRMVHPFLAIGGSAYIVWTCTALLKQRLGNDTRNSVSAVLGLILFQLAVGGINITLLAPEWMQLFHLFVADLVWIAMIVMMVRSSATPGECGFALADSSRARNNC